MPVRVMLDIFSGRPNPVVTLPNSEARELLRTFHRGRGLTAMASVEHPFSPSRIRLGYRGIVVQQGGDLVDRAAPAVMRLGDKGAEEDFLGRMAELTPIDENLQRFVNSDMRQMRGEVVGASAGPRATPGHAAEEHAVAALAAGCDGAPFYEPHWWNDGGQRQLNNNCYNYSTNHRTDSYAQPGRASGLGITLTITAVVKSLAMADGLIDAPLMTNQCPAEGHLVALVVAPGFDFHWYRKGRDGLWTHKAGFTPTTNLDNIGAIIRDPRTANRGPYTEFSGFMLVNHGHIKLL